MVVEGLLYTQDHEWAKVEGDVVTVGITDFAQEQLGEITFVELPPTDTELKVHQELGVVESSKAASDVYSPVDGAVVEANTELESTPELINEDCYKAGWICKIKIADKAPLEKLMDAKHYKEYLEGM